MTNVKELAGRQAAELVRDGMIVGLGTGSTVHFALVRIAERVRDEHLKIRGVPTSVATELEARALGIPLATLDEITSIDLTIDGADEIDGHFDMIKGGGGALLREKVIASISTRTAIVVGANKCVELLGSTFALPVEVVPFARSTVARALIRLGAVPRLRMIDGGPFVTDNQNHILDCRFARGIDDAERLEREIASVPGAVESGLFIGLAQVAFIGRDDGTCERRDRRA